jgi:hypothetical protein
MSRRRLCRRIRAPAVERPIKESITAKLFTVDEANSQVPRLVMLLERLQRSALRLDEERRSVAAARGVDPRDVSSAMLVRHRPEAGARIEELEALVHEIERDGAQLKDVALGLVDFPCEIDGEVVLLCWQFGEPEVAFWHRAGEGFAGRRSLAGRGAPPTLQ